MKQLKVTVDGRSYVVEIEPLDVPSESNPAQANSAKSEESAVGVPVESPAWSLNQLCGSG